MCSTLDADATVARGLFQYLWTQRAARCHVDADRAVVLGAWCRL
jgi:hypothetical protein